LLFDRGRMVLLWISMDVMTDLLASFFSMQKRPYAGRS
jgi:hypothetical protein